MVLKPFVSGEVNFAHLVKVVPARLLHSKDLSFPFVINKHLVGRHSDVWQISELSWCSGNIEHGHI